VKPPRSTSAKKCPHCGTTTIPANRHRHLPSDQRDGIRPRQWTDGTCNLCAKRINAGLPPVYVPDERADTLAYEGGWVRRGLILVPTRRGAA